ncbi:PAS domain-containing protein [Paenibacillus mucilaginosus]|uniref:Serine phosphatase n=2 Tax=Paenibacillus mucilaginosus TaxID=61624 RepID=H6NI60_9BACL|nr:PAS domain-containing protein [Paenibacillus mucilaginosus]AEI43863.1 serine phosphatase [Paenibacillus mucilaginosus KNP414]AFC31463.1 serine phosphatase [Paenibacillus mucilaginosus 3016]MCG7212627.1 PAS domain-containing protein [Paenibacillus mucilaginosus]WDM25351.1 PAS domain-containing protein [Paenibacillus mucilaginosus]WFA20009.1 serine/threonine protein phosphatase [Paenibacillus mucilaginosus]
MDDRLDRAPCGYLTVQEDCTILESNQTLAKLLGSESSKLAGRPLHSVLAVSSRIFFQIYFFPLMHLEGKVEEMYLSLQAVSGQEIPVLLNAVRREREGKTVFEFILVPMRRRMDYEQQLSASEHAVSKAKLELERLERTLERKRKEWLELNGRTPGGESAEAHSS